MINKIIAANNELQQVYVRGIDAVHMAKALMAIEEVYNELLEQETAKVSEENQD